MNIAVSPGLAPSVCSAGPMITQEMMNDAVTGTAMPSTAMAIAENTAVSTSTAVGSVASACAARTSRSASVWPSPVFTMTEVMMPAAAHTEATGSTARMPVASARYRSPA